MHMVGKPKIAIYWCASCGGCDEAIVDLAEDILGLLENVDIIFWPCATDFKRKDLENLPDGMILASFINGAIRSTEQEEMVRLLRQKTKYVIAYGACSQLGGIPGLANLYSREELLRFVYEEAPSTVNTNKVYPKSLYNSNNYELTLPQLWNVVRALDQVIKVDYYIPGCPPTPNITKQAVGILLEGKIPPTGTVLAPDVALCSECPRRDTKPTDLSFVEFKRPHLVEIDNKKCLLAQSILCMGPATRAGCGALCISGNMPCSGCFGPTSRVKDQGAKIMSSLCSNIAYKDENSIDKVLDSVVDPIGYFYRYSLPKSFLRRKINLPVS